MNDILEKYIKENHKHLKHYKLQLRVMRGTIISRDDIKESMYRVNLVGKKDNITTVKSVIIKESDLLKFKSYFRETRLNKLLER